MDNEENRDNWIDDFMASEPGNQQWEQQVPMLEKRFPRLLAEDQVRVIERLSELSGSGEAAELIGRLEGKKGVSLPARVELARARKKLGQEVDDSLLRSMEQWLGLCETEEGDCDAAGLWLLPEQVQESVIDHLSLWLRADLLGQFKDAAPNKKMAKYIARAIHKAKSAGATITGEQARTFVMGERDEYYDEAYVSPPDPQGTVFIYMYRTVFGKATLFVALLNDRMGVIRFDAYRVSRPKFDKMLESTRKNPHAIVIKADPGFVRRFIRACEEQGRKKGSPPNEEYLRNRRALGLVEEPEGDHPLWSMLDREAMAKERGLVSRSRELLEHRMFEDWRLTGPEEGKLLSEIAEMRNSVIELTPAQKREREDTVFESEAKAVIESEGRGIWRDRLLYCAYLLFLMKDEDTARMAAAVGMSLERADEPLAGFFVELIRRSVERALAPDDEGSHGPDMGRGGIVIA